MTQEQFTLTPIGIISTPFKSKYDAPRQPATSLRTTVGVITLSGGRNFEQALDDLKGFEFVWILFWFHENTGWKPKVLPPFGGRTKRGVFATRSPHRPNPIGLSLCRLLDIKGRTITVENPDMIDGTPILDIKPYLPHAESKPRARSGWIADMNERSQDQYRVVFLKGMKQFLAGLRNEDAQEVEAYLTTILARDPFPHSYRRIRRQTDGSYTIAVKRWRFTFAVKGRRVTIHSGWHMQGK